GGDHGADADPDGAPAARLPGASEALARGVTRAGVGARGPRAARLASVCVAEGAEAGSLRFAQRAAFGGAGARGECGVAGCQQGFEGGCLGGERWRVGVGFVGVGGEIVELWASVGVFGGDEELGVLVDEGGGVAADVDLLAGGEELEDDVGSTGAGEVGGERLALEAGLGWQAGQVEDRGGDVQKRHAVRDHAAGGNAGTDDEERDADALLVERVAVLQAAVLAELLTVVGGEHDDRVIEQPAAAESVEDA